MAEITVYSKPNCFRCEAVKKYLQNNGVKFEVIDVLEDNKAVASLRDKGYAELPVVDIGGNIHTGFRPDVLAKVVV